MTSKLVQDFCQDGKCLGESSSYARDWSLKPENIVNRSMEVDRKITLGYTGEDGGLCKLVYVSNLHRSGIETDVQLLGRNHLLSKMEKED